MSSAIASLAPNYIFFPGTEQEVRHTQIGFYNIARFPKVIGAMDCTHVRISSPGGPLAEVFRNRKGYFSLNVQGICNSNLEFTDIVARWPGSSHDSHIFSSCAKKIEFDQGFYRDSVLIVDAGYASKPYLMPPLEDPATPEEHLYNESQIRTRNPVERLFGCWKRRFPVLALGMRLKLDNIFPVIIATAVLHNIVRKAGEDLPEDDPQLNLPFPWENLLRQGEMNGRLLCRRRPDAVRASLINNYFRSLLPQ